MDIDSRRGDQQQADPRDSGACPHWCAVHDKGHELHRDGLDVHVSGSLVVKGTVLRLASPLEPAAGTANSPFVYVGDEEYTLHEAEVLIDALTRLVDEGAAETQPVDLDASVRVPTRGSPATRT